MQLRLRTTDLKLYPLNTLFVFFKNVYLLFLTEVQLIYNVVLITAVQQSDSVIHIHSFFKIFFSIIVQHRILNEYSFLCYTVGLLFIHCIYRSLYVQPQLLTATLPQTPSPLVATSLVSMYLILFLFHSKYSFNSVPQALNIFIIQ